MIMPEGEPADAGGRDGEVQDRDDDEREPGAEAAEHGEQRQVAAADAQRPGAAVGPRPVGLLDAQPDHRRVRDRERQHRAEGVHVAEEFGLARDDRQAGDAAEQQDPDPGRREARVQPAEAVGDLAVQPHRVDEPRGADDARVGGDEQDRRGEDADVDLAGRLQRAEVQVLDDPEHRVAGVAAFGLARAEQRRVATVRAAW